MTNELLARIDLLEEENQELKLELSGYRQAILNNKEMLGLKEQNEKLKKQLEENKDKINWYENFEINKTIDKLRIKHNNQQKEFIEYLENEITDTKLKWGNKLTNNGYLDIAMTVRAYEQILSKYKEIIGSDINVGSIGGKE